MDKALARKPEQVSRPPLAHRAQKVPRRSGVEIRSILRSPSPQAKLEISRADDVHEREADRVADRILRSPEPTEDIEDRDEKLDRQADSGGEVEGDDGADPLPDPDEQELESLAKLQRKPTGATARAVAPAAVGASVLSPGPGRPLQESTRAFMEPRFGHDFSSVRVHDTPRDRRSAEAVGARAFTHGQHIWFGPGNEESDRRLLAHELVHVVQQTGGRKAAEEKVSTSPLRLQRFGLDSLAEGAREKALETFAGWAMDVPGYPLLRVVLGRDPISGAAVERSPHTVVQGLLGLIPGGNRIYQNLDESGALEEAFAWLDIELRKLNLTWESIKGLFKSAWDSLGATDLLNLSGAWNKVKSIFAEPVQRITAFVTAAVKKIGRFILEAALRKAGELGQKVLDVLQTAGETIELIISDPVAFCQHLIAAVAKGFGQFRDDILVHLKAGLLGWLFGAMEGAGIQIPEKFDLRGLLSIVLQVLGLTYGHLRKKMVKVLGEKRVVVLEEAFEFVRILVTQGLAAAWEKILEYMGSLKDMVLGSIRDWVVTKVVTAAVTKIVSMFNPAGAVLQAIMAVYNTVAFFIERIKQIVALAEAVFSSIRNIALGKIQAAADYVEATMARTLPVIISFLARLVGLGGVSEKIKAIIQKIQAKVDAALDKVVNFVVGKAKAVAGKVKDATGAVVEWWKSKKKVAVGQREFSLHFEGEEDRAKLVVSASPPQSYTEFFDSVAVDMQTGEQKAALGRARALGAEIEQKIKGKNRSAVESEQLVASLNALAAEFPRMFGDSAVPPSRITYGPLTAEQGGTLADAEVLSSDPGGSKGSEPSDAPPIWLAVRKRKNDTGASAYVQGHLLNHNVWGPGKRFNMTPITGSANGLHKNRVENDVKARIGRSEVLHYRVEADYTGEHKRSKAFDQLKQKQADGSLTEAEGTQLEMMEADRRLCRRIKTELHVLQDEKGTKKDPPEKVGERSITIENVIPQEAPAVDGVGGPKRLVRLNPLRPGTDETRAVRALTHLKSVGEARAKAILAFAQTDGSGREALIAAVPGITESDITVWMTSTTNDIGEPIVVDFTGTTDWV